MWKTRLKIVLWILGVPLALGLLVGLFLPRFSAFRPGPPQIVNTATILQQVQTLSHLTTIKYVLEKVVILEDVKWYGENRVLLVAHGTVKAGVDLNQLSADDIELSGKRVTIRLPHPLITDAYLDEQKTRVIEHSTGLLRTFDKDLQQTARRQALDDIRRAARNNGILDDARERAESQLQALFVILGFEQVTVQTKK